jgi:DNA (cytosine-5)-methyltransferase 1
MQPRELALFAEAGGGLYGSLLLGWRTVGAVEVEPYAREVLLRRQKDGVLDLFPIWSDVRTFDGRAWSGCVDVVSAGFPCQPFSSAGPRRGADDKLNLWPETARILGEVRPPVAFLENVPDLARTPYFGRVLGDLADVGLDARWDVVSAADCGAPHGRPRLWVLAYSDRERLAAVQERSRRRQLDAASGWPRGPRLQRVADGVAFPCHRLRAIGSGQIPRVAAFAFNLLASEVLK